MKSKIKNSSKVALITGVNGQDGSYLAKHLLEKNFRVIGTIRTLNDNLWRLKYHGLENHINLVECNLLEPESLINLLKTNQDITQIYNLAAISYVHTSFSQPISTFNSNTIPVLQLLEFMRTENKKIRLYQASTSEMFGNTKSVTLNENSPMDPKSPYGIAKLASYHLVRMYRYGYNLFASNGILFNHESPLRSDVFVTKKIAQSLARYKKNLPRRNDIGNIYSRRDWGHANDYVKGMYKILTYKSPDDFILSTNTSYSVKEFINYSLDYLNIKYKWVGKDFKNMKCIDLSNSKIIFKVDQSNLRPLDVTDLKGNYSKAKNLLGWKPDIKFKKLVNEMIRYELEAI